MTDKYFRNHFDFYAAYCQFTQLTYGEWSMAMTIEPYNLGQKMESTSDGRHNLGQYINDSRYAGFVYDVRNNGVYPEKEPNNVAAGFTYFMGVVVERLKNSPPNFYESGEIVVEAIFFDTVGGFLVRFTLTRK